MQGAALRETQPTQSRSSPREPSFAASLPLLDVRSLTVDFTGSSSTVRAVDAVDFSVDAGGTLGIVGESGSGKSVTALSIMRLVRPPGRIIRGAIQFGDRDLASLSDAQMQSVRGREIAMVFQEPMTSLNPVFRIGEQIAEVLRLHEGLDRQGALTRATAMLDAVRIPSAARIAREFPHQLSGGMRQRVMIAMALACQPKLLIADEPTTALDVTIQAQILELIAELRQQLGMALLLITHDMGVIAESVDRVGVMYGARIVESAPVRRLFESPLHPYTQGLLRSIPRRGAANRPRERLAQIPGTVPTLTLPLAPGCRFAPRCNKATPRCQVETPALVEISPGHQVACLEVSP